MEIKGITENTVDFLRGRIITGGLQVVVGATDIGLGIAFVGGVSEVTGGLGAILAMPLGAFMTGVGSYEIEHGLHNIMEGWSSQEHMNSCP